MSGLEFIVGTVLASVPLALEAYDRSGRVYEIYSVLKDYPRELRITEDLISAQRTIFRNHARNLLVAMTHNPHIIQDIMQNPSVQTADVCRAPAMAIVGKHGSDYLREPLTACGHTARNIHESLETLSSQFEAFRNGVREKDKETSIQDWLKYVASRCKLGLYKPKIKSTIDELRALNRDFGLISEQISKALQAEGQRRTSPHQPSKYAKGLNSLNRYHHVRDASNALYSSLQVRWMCSTHKSHVFDLRVLDGDSRRAEGKGKDKASVPSYVTCDLAITHDGAANTHKSPLRLEVEQACGSYDWGPPTHSYSIESDAMMQQLVTIFEPNDSQKQAVVAGRSERKTHKHHDISKKLQRKTDHPQLRPELSVVTSQVTNVTQSVTGESQRVPNTPVTDLSLVEDICKWSREVTVNCMSRSLIGSWAEPQAKLFCVPISTPSTSQSLSEMISWVADNPILRSMSRSLLFKLASDLADGVMQFYSTPWLAFQDLGHHVRYIKSVETPQVTPNSFKGPYFATRLDRSSSPRHGAVALGLPNSVSSIPSSTTASCDYPEARNPLLFGLGILLLEIGYCRPWHELQRDIKGSSAGRQKSKELSDYRVAEKLAVAAMLENQMSRAYSKIIRKCLGCDFGLGETDLANEELQARFVTEVVLELQQLEQLMKERDAELQL